ncbi:hypothetical protein ACJBP2_10310, partial [Streptococcus suis]
MKKFFAYLLVFLISSGLALVLAYKHDLYTWEKPQQNMWIQGGTLFDATSEFAISNPGVLVADGKIACLGESCNVTEKTLI